MYGTVWVFFLSFFFFFSSRRRHTRLVSDWSSDVCSSDLAFGTLVRGGARQPPGKALQLAPGTGEPPLEPGFQTLGSPLPHHLCKGLRVGRSEERRVGKECRGGWSWDQ